LIYYNGCAIQSATSRGHHAHVCPHELCLVLHASVSVCARVLSRVRGRGCACGGAACRRMVNDMSVHECAATPIPSHHPRPLFSLTCVWHSKRKQRRGRGGWSKRAREREGEGRVGKREGGKVRGDRAKVTSRTTCACATCDRNRGKHAGRGRRERDRRLLHLVEQAQIRREVAIR